MRAGKLNYILVRYILTENTIDGVDSNYIYIYLYIIFINIYIYIYIYIYINMYVYAIL